MTKKGRILVAESCGIVSKDIETLLEEWGYASFDVVRSDHDALQLTQDAHPNLVIIDKDLRGQSGGEAVAQQINTQYHVPVIFLTDWLSQEWMRQIEQLKSFYCLSKPFDCSELHHLIDETMVAWQN